MPSLKTYLAWNDYHRVLQKCALLTKKYGKKVTVYMFLRMSVQMALSKSVDSFPTLEDRRKAKK